jgi:hypothetical protein
MENSSRDKDLRRDSELASGVISSTSVVATAAGNHAKSSVIEKKVFSKDAGPSSKFFRSPLSTLSSSDINIHAGDRPHSNQSNPTANTTSTGGNATFMNYQSKVAKPFIFEYKIPESNTEAQAATISGNSSNSLSNSKARSVEISNLPSSNRSKTPNLNTAVYESPQKVSSSPNAKAIASPSLRPSASKQHSNSNASNPSSLSSAKQPSSFHVFQMKLKDIEIAHLKKENAFLKLR